MNSHGSLARRVGVADQLGPNLAPVVRAQMPAANAMTGGSLDAHGLCRLHGLAARHALVQVALARSYSQGDLGALFRCDAHDREHSESLQPVKRFATPESDPHLHPSSGLREISL